MSIDLSIVIIIVGAVIINTNREKKKKAKQVLLIYNVQVTNIELDFDFCAKELKKGALHLKINLQYFAGFIISIIDFPQLLKISKTYLFT
jgi:hypothetical protein